MKVGKFKALGAFLVVSIFAGCSGKSSTGEKTVVPTYTGPEVSENDIPPGTEKTVPGPNGSQLRIVNIGPRGNALYIEVEGTLSSASFTQLRSERGEAGVAQALDASVKDMKKAGAIPISQNAELAYVSFFLPYHTDILSSLKPVNFKHEFYFNPVHYDTESLKQMKAFSAQSEGFAIKSLGRSGTKGFSGLERMNAVEFVKKAMQDIGTGEAVDGSSVKVGITDTGITYNHPTFRDSQGKVRIAYMKDFTREGRSYFNPASAFKATAVAGAPGIFSIEAQALVSPKLPEFPNPEKFVEIKDFKIKASADLKVLLEDPAKKTVLGLLTEAVFEGDAEVADINGNGKVDDVFPMLYVMGAAVADDTLFVDFTGTGDFSKSTPIKNFNTSGNTVKVFAEKIGFALQVDALPKPGTADLVELRSASIVGFDPGNHGSHVAGIAAGRKTISTDSDDTLARGVAPNAQILMDRVCANNGGCSASRAMVDLATVAGAEVINMSLGGLNPFNDGYGVQETLVNRIVALKNVIFMISAGNSGPGRQTLGSPSTARLSLSVGASASREMIQRQYQYPGTGTLPPAGQDDDFMLFFSSRGPTANGGFKPNIVAPGTELSSVQLNAAPGARSGLDVYWGTSMAAPSATGAYALLLDAIKKFNKAHPANMITTDAFTLRQVIIGSARPFGKEQYSWIDQGTGIIDLVATWDALLAMRTGVSESGVKDAFGKDLELDYQVMTSITAPNGIKYDGSRQAEVGLPEKVAEFGAGVFVDVKGSEAFTSVNIARRLTEAQSSSPDVGDLEAQLRTSAEEFVLKSDFGNDAAWFKAGTLSQVDCLNSPVDNLTVLGRGAEIAKKEDGTSEIVPFAASTLNVCLDRVTMSQMKAGDHGALIYAYRTRGGKVSSIPSFIVPVYFTQPHQTLAGSTAYDIKSVVKSFGVERNYVAVPKGTTIAKITLSVPAYKPGEPCSGVELMLLQGGNTLAPAGARATRRVSNCRVKDGSPETDPAKLQLVLTQTNPKAGIWDIDVFGQYQFASSSYSLRVDYIVGEASVKEIEALPSTLLGKFQFMVKESSVAIALDQAKSSFTIDSLFHSENSQVAQDDRTVVGGPLGQLRQYPADVTSVTITTGGSPGNDIDLDVVACPLAQTSVEDFSACETVGESGGSTDVEKVTFKPGVDKKYAVRVNGYAIKDEGKFIQGEELTMKAEAGMLAISGAAPLFDIAYDFTAAVPTSVILNHALFTSGQYQAQGAVKLVASDGTLLGAVRTRVNSK